MVAKTLLQRLLLARENARIDCDGVAVKTRNGFCERLRKYKIT